MKPSCKIYLGLIIAFSLFFIGQSAYACGYPCNRPENPNPIENEIGLSGSDSIEGNIEKEILKEPADNSLLACEGVYCLFKPERPGDINESELLACSYNCNFRPEPPDEIKETSGVA